MSPEDIAPGSPSDWLRHAWSDLELAQVVRNSRILLEDLSFHAEQAAEKALKAVLIFKSIPFPKTHNIRTLLDLLPRDVIPTKEVKEAAGLTDYAVLSRYPGDLEPVTDEEYRKALSLAEIVVKWAEGVIKGG